MQTVAQSLGKCAPVEATGIQVMKKVTWRGEKMCGIGISAFLRSSNTNLQSTCIMDM